MTKRSDEGYESWLAGWEKGMKSLASLPKGFGSWTITFEVDGMVRDDLEFTLKGNVIDVQLAFFMWNTNYRLGKPRDYLEQARIKLN